MSSSPIDHVLSHYDLGHLHSSIFLNNAGGFSGAQFWKIECDRGSFALRRWGHSPPTTILDIHQILFQVANAEVPVALPLPARTNETLIHERGSYWEMSTWMPGVADFNRNGNQNRLNDAIDQLARFHQASHVQGVSSTSQTLIERMDRLKSSEATIFQLQHAATQTTSFWSPVISQCVPDLFRHTQRLEQQLTPFLTHEFPCGAVIRDIHHDHLLFEQDKLTGIIDFEAMRVDSCCLDLARMVGSLSLDGTTPWIKAIERYALIRPLSLRERELIPLLHACNVVLGLLNWLKWLEIDKRTFDDPKSVSQRLKNLQDQLNVLDLGWST